MAMTLNPLTGQFVPYALKGSMGPFGRGPSGRPISPAYGMGVGSQRPGRAPISTLQSPSPRGPVSKPLGGLQQKRKFLGPGEKLPSATLKGSSPQPLKGKRAPTKRTGGMGSRPGVGGKEGPYYGGKPMFSAASRAALPKGSSLSSQMRKLQGGRTGGARSLLSRGRLDPMARMQMGRGGFPGRRQVSSFISGGRR
jgi:hypothetical protein